MKKLILEVIKGMLIAFLIIFVIEYILKFRFQIVSLSQVVELIKDILWPTFATLFVVYFLYKYFRYRKLREYSK
ncbi:MAG: hypothetical protein KA807_10700 [Prolixibacteraceae bacterium]|nr:hypothetical protein [Prolixibacteraceae bacterium]